MFWRDPSIVKGTSSIWSVMFSVLAILVIAWIIALNISDPIWRWSVAGIGTIVAFGSPGGLTCLYWIFSPRFRKQHRAYRRGGPLPGGPDAPEPIRIPRKQFHAWANGAMKVLHELPPLSTGAKFRLQLTDQPIVSADVEDLVGKLAEMQRKINNEAEWEINDSKDGQITEWDRTSHACFVVPTIQTVNAPKNICDSVLFMVNNGARRSDLILKLIIAEMDVAVARWYMVLNATWNTSGPMATALLATMGMTPEKKAELERQNGNQA